MKLFISQNHFPQYLAVNLYKLISLKLWVKSFFEKETEYSLIRMIQSYYQQHI